MPIMLHFSKTGSGFLYLMKAVYPSVYGAMKECASAPVMVKEVLSGWD